MDDCIFCKIIKKELPAKIEYEDKELIVFYDINPAADLHLLITPKRHLDGMENLGLRECRLLGKVFQLTNKLIREKRLRDGYYRVAINGGKSQVVPHLHFHLLGGKWKRFI